MEAQLDQFRYNHSIKVGEMAGNKEPEESDNAESESGSSSGHEHFHPIDPELQEGSWSEQEYIHLVREAILSNLTTNIEYSPNS